MNISRYEAQMELDGIGGIGQKKLSNASVLVVGCGGLGSYILPLLVGSGIGKLYIVDSDDVEIGNLHRQTIYNEDDVGTSKAKAAYKYLSNLNSNVTIQMFDKKLDQDILDIFLEEDNKIVVDAGDNFELTYMLDDFCSKNDIYLVVGSAIKTTGQIGIFNKDLPRYKGIFPGQKTASKCSQQGVLGTNVAMIGCMQAQIVISLILEKDTHKGFFYRWNANTFSMSKLNIGVLNND